jgi:hypothetical protein
MKQKCCERIKVLKIKLCDYDGFVIYGDDVIYQTSCQAKSF